MSNRVEAAKRLGARFLVCAQCGDQYAWHEEETFSVMTPQVGGDYDDGDNDVVFCCSHECASRKLATLGRGIIWRGGKCGGTLMPSLENDG